VKGLLVAVVAALASTTGAVTQLPGAAGCLDRTGAAGCAQARAVADPFALAVSPDGRNVYAAGGVGSLGAVGIFVRNRSSGALRQLAGRSGCLARLPSRVCGTGRGLETPAAIAISPDGRIVAIAGRNGRSIGLYRRSLSGALTATGCFQTRATSGCREAPGLEHVSGLAFAPDGRALVAATGAGLVTFRSAAGRLSFFQLAKTKGMVAVASTPDSSFVYAVGGGGTRGWLDVFERRSNGELNRIQCVEQGESADCQAATGLEQPAGVAVSPDNRYVYVVSTVSAAVATFERTKVGAVGAPRVLKSRSLAGATGIALGRGRVYVSSRKFLTQLTPAGGTLIRARSFHLRGVSDLRAVATTGRNVYVAGRGLAVMKVS
jgi:6-phosphogluconolactonase (cycloisomerase 2 family)